MKTSRRFQLLLAATLVVGAGGSAWAQAPGPEPQPPPEGRLGAETREVGLESLSAARVLVTTDGQRIRVRGSWSVTGSRIRYTSLAGALTTIDSTAIDLAATASAHEAVIAAEREARAPRRAALPPIQQALQASRPTGEVRLELDDTTVAAFVPPDPVSQEELDSARRQRVLDALPANEITVASWEDVGTDGKPQIYGVLRNDGESTSRAIAVEVQLLDEEGAVVGRQAASIPSDRLDSGEGVRFSARFPEAVRYSTVEFAIQ
ncbi:MAG TPA: FxLYD domain-containing protein [Thermoanaerobaculia bacterium]|nr:FxLYD domain-containing protein [Thermoanaerobaculia bacterium]